METSDRKFYEKIGSMGADIENLHGKVDRIITKVDTTNEQVIKLNTSTVKQKECTQRTRMIADKLSNLKDMIATKQTRQAYPAITADQTGPILTQFSSETEKKKWYIRIKDNAATLAVILSVVGLVVVGGIKFARFVVTLESIMQKHDVQTKKDDRAVEQIKKELRKLRKEVAKD